MDITTNETSKRLKEAGFPQPDFATGQLWYNSHGALSFIGKKELGDDGKTYFFCTSIDTARTERMIPIKDGAFYAPSAADVLRELGDRYYISVNKGWDVSSLWKEICDQYDEHLKVVTFTVKLISEHKSIAETAASAWLAINEK